MLCPKLNALRIAKKVVEVRQTSVIIELYKSICVCSSDPRTASKRTKQKNKYIFNWAFQLWQNLFIATL